MARILEAVYEDGVLKPIADPGLRNHERVLIEIKDLIGEQIPQRMSRTFGSAKGLITMAEDFDEPIEGFRDAVMTVKDDHVRPAIEAGLEDAEKGRCLSVEEVRAKFALPELSAWHEVYEGLSEEEIAAIEALVLDRRPQD